LLGSAGCQQPWESEPQRAFALLEMCLMPKWFDNENFGQRLHKRERERERERAQLFGRLSFVCLLGYRWCANHVLHARFFVMININQYFTIWLLFIQPIHISLACVHAECNLLIDLFAARARSYFTRRVRCVSRVSECAHSIFLFYQQTRSLVAQNPFLCASARRRPIRRCSAPPASQLCLFWIMRRAPMKIKLHIRLKPSFFYHSTFSNGKFDVFSVGGKWQVPGAFCSKITIPLVRMLAFIC
jgi:hypothetical protein